MIYQKYLVKGEDHFDPERYPALISEMASVDIRTAALPSEYKAEMLLCYLKNERINNAHEAENPGLASLISSETLPLENAFSLFAASGSNRMFRNELEEFIRSRLNGREYI
jgi:hypothetical protein